MIPQNSDPAPMEPAQPHGGHNLQQQAGPSTEKPTTGLLCRYMGLPSDPETHYSFPSVGNHCHRVKSPASISFLHQQTYCLNEKHRICPVYQKSWNGRLPDGLTSHSVSAKKNHRVVWLVLILLILLLVAGAVYPVLRNYLLAPLPDHAHAGTELEAPASPTVQTTETSTPVPAAISPDIVHLALPTPTPSPRPTQVPTTTRTATARPPTPGPLLETPFGSSIIYILHQVKPGESVGVIASRYGVSSADIHAANPRPQGATIWPGEIIVIPTGVNDPGSILPMQVLYLEQPASVAAIAEQYQLTAVEIRQLNLLGPEDNIPAGRYIILPH